MMASTVLWLSESSLFGCRLYDTTGSPRRVSSLCGGVCCHDNYMHNTTELTAPHSLSVVGTRRSPVEPAQMLVLDEVNRRERCEWIRTIFLVNC